MTTLTPVPRRRTAGPPSSAPSTASTIKPILKTKSILGTRSRSEDDDGADLHDSPIKKRKTVIINEDLNMTQTFGGKSVEDAKRDIKKALDGHARGRNQDYENLIELFAPSKQPNRSDDDSETDEDDNDYDPDAPKSQHLYVYVVAMSSFATSLGSKCSGLVRAILDCAWLERDEGFSKAYIQLVAALSSAQASYLARVLSMMVEKFNPTILARRGPLPVVPGFPPVDSETRKQRLHLGLKYLLELFPAGDRIILGLLEQKYPFSDDPKSSHMDYINHLLSLKETRPDLERDIMELILGKIVKIDVEMSLDLENDEDETVRAVLGLLGSPTDGGESGSAKVMGGRTDAESDAESDFSEDDSDDDDDDGGDDGGEPTAEEQKVARILELKNKTETIDSALDLLFGYYSPIFENPDSPKALETFEDMLSDFSNVILPHLKSRHTQFLLFKFALSSPGLQDLFLGTLLNIASQHDRPPIVKQAAVQYLASFTARGAKLNSQQVQVVVKLLLEYINLYRVSHKNCLGPDLRKYTLYYTYFQSLLYVFCYRWKDLIDRDSLPRAVEWDDPASFVGQHLPWMEGLRTVLQENIASKLNPLKCCAPFIVEEFAKLAHHLGLMYCFPKIEQNKNVSLSQFSAGVGSYARDGPLRDTGYEANVESYLEPSFPFDPYQLPLSKRWLDLDSNYISWQNIALLHRDDEESELEHDGLESEVDDTATDDEHHA